MALSVSITVSSSSNSPVFINAGDITDVSFGTNEHGFSSLSAIYLCSLSESFSIYDRAGLPHVTVTDNGNTVWEGRLEDVAIVDGGVSLTAFGYQRALSDTLYTATHTAASSSTIAAALVADVAATNSTQLSTSTALITTNALSVTETYNDMRPAEILNRLAGYGDTSGNLWEWGVYNQRILYFRQRGSAGRAWYVDATAIKLERSLDKLYNSAYATYTGSAANTTSRTSAATDSASISRYGITREAVVNAQAKDSAAATYQAATFLADNKDATPRAQIAFSSVYDASGGKWPLYMVRAGDTITIRNLPPTISTTVDKIRTFYVARTNYSADNDVLTVEPSAYTPTIDNQISAGTGSTSGGVDADPRTYTDTEYNTFTPAFAGTGTAGTFTYTRQTGQYQRVGNKVTFSGNVFISAISVAPTGNMTITGLPFTAQNTVSINYAVNFGYIYNFNYAASALDLTGLVDQNTSAIALYESFDNGASVEAPAANFTNVNCRLGFSGSYFI